MILSSKDRVVGVQGYAGTGKTTMLNRARALSEKKGYRMLGLAPSASAVKTLSAEAGIESETLQGFLDRNAGVAEKEEPGYDPERPITRPLFPERADVIVHDERGRVSCICPETGEVRAMAFQGFEAERGACGTVEYRCPAAAFGFNCVGSKACHRAGGVKPGEYGRIVRVDLDKHDRRIFTPTPWGSPSGRRGYNRRSAMERINGRLDNSFNFETPYIRGLAKMKTRVGLALAVMMALALGRVRAGRAGRMRSPVGAVPYPDTG